MSVKKVGHLLIAVHFWYGCYYEWCQVKVPASLSKGGDFGPRPLKFLTFWDLLLQSTFFTICFLNDIIGTNDDLPKKTPLIRKIKDILLPTLCFPLAMFVGVTFWGLYFIDRELIYPVVLDKYIPYWQNHLLHTNIMIFAFLELITSYRKYPTRKVGILVLSLFLLTYLVWMLYIRSYTKKWVYQVIEVFNVPGRIVFFLLCLVLSGGFYFLGEKINTLRWESRIASKKE